MFIPTFVIVHDFNRIQNIFDWGELDAGIVMNDPILAV